MKYKEEEDVSANFRRGDPDPGKTRFPQSSENSKRRGIKGKNKITNQRKMKWPLENKAKQAN